MGTVGIRLSRQPLLATLRLGIHPPWTMQKMSRLILALAEQVLVQPTEKSSREAVAAALLLAHVAWNRAVDPLGGDQIGYYQKVLGALEAENPKCLRELKTTDCEALIQDLVKIKATRYPTPSVKRVPPASPRFDL